MPIIGRQFAEYAGQDVERWKIILGRRAQVSGIGFGTVEATDAPLVFRVRFSMSAQERNQVYASDIVVGIEEFSQGKIGYLLQVDLPRERDRRTPHDAKAEKPDAKRGSVHDPKPVASQTADLRRAEIKALCDERKISWLYHFTRLTNLHSILREGLQSREHLEQDPRYSSIKFNDPYRFDGQKGSVSLSIGFPSYRMFYRLRHQHTEPWVVLQIQASVLWELDCAFYQHNAASAETRKISLAQRKSADSLRSLFGDLPDRKREDLRILSSFTTDPQAEVLVFDPVPPSRFSAIYFENAEICTSWADRSSPDWKAKARPGHSYFERRCDYIYWGMSNSAAGSSAPVAPGMA